MKILTREEERAHYNETLKGGVLGGVGGLAVGTAGLMAAVSRYPAFRHLTLPLRAFLITSSSTFGAIVTADHYSRLFEASRHPETGYQDPAERARTLERESLSRLQLLKTWGKEHRYQIVVSSWLASMVGALALTGRNPYLSTQQKLVQARVYAQGLTIAVLLISAVFEVGDRGREEGRYETVKVIDENDPEHKRVVEKQVKKHGDNDGQHERYKGEEQWRDMVAAEEEKMKAREEALHEREEKEGRHHKGHKHGKEHAKGGEGNGKGKEAEKKQKS